MLQQCNCTPSFHALGYKERPVFCLGLQLLCMNNIMKSIGKYNKVGSAPIACESGVMTPNISLGGAAAEALSGSV